jgi:uncharacterized protein (TIGR02466 family)
MNIEETGAYFVHPLFSYPVFESQISEITDEEKQFIFNCEYVRFYSNDGFITKNIYILNLPEMNRIKQEILKSFNLYCQKVICVSDEIKFKFTTSWVIKHLHGDSAQRHLHANSIFSGILYVKTPQKCGNLVFHRGTDSRSLFPSTVFTENYKKWNIFNAQSFTFEPSDNKILIFPSTLLHSVTQNLSNEDRYCIAFNFFPIGKIGSDLTELFLS